MSPDPLHRHMVDALQTADENLAIARARALELKECRDAGHRPQQIPAHGVDGDPDLVRQRTEVVEERGE